MELLVVVAIMLILATVGFSNFIFSIKKAHDAQRKSDLATIAKGLEAYANDFGVYPSGDASGKIVACSYACAAQVACNAGSPLASCVSSVVTTYLAEIPDDPVSGQDYFYEKTSTGFKLYAALENTSDPSYKSGLTVSCGTGVTCNYQLTESGVN